MTGGIRYTLWFILLSNVLNLETQNSSGGEPQNSNSGTNQRVTWFVPVPWPSVMVCSCSMAEHGLFLFHGRVTWFVPVPWQSDVVCSCSMAEWRGLFRLHGRVTWFAWPSLFQWRGLPFSNPVNDAVCIFIFQWVIRFFKTTSLPQRIPKIWFWTFPTKQI